MTTITTNPGTVTVETTTTTRITPAYEPFVTVNSVTFTAERGSHPMIVIRATRNGAVQNVSSFGAVPTNFSILANLIGDAATAAALYEYAGGTR